MAQIFATLLFLGPAGKPEGQDDQHHRVRYQVTWLFSSRRKTFALKKYHINKNSTAHGNLLQDEVDLCLILNVPPICTLSILGNLTLFTQQDPESMFPSQDAVWDRFEQAFLAVWGLVTYAPVFRDYYYQGLTQFYMDNVMYLELRGLLPEVS